MTRAIAWGAIWALAGGFWLLGTLIVSTHRLTVETPIEAVPVIGVLCILFAFIGSVLGALIHAVRMLVERMTGRRTADRAWRRF